MEITCHRIERAGLDHDRLLLPEHQRSILWTGEAYTTCAACQRSGQIWVWYGDVYDDDGGYWDTCPDCGGLGELNITEQAGVSACRTIDDLVEYFRGREASIDAHVIVEMVGEETGERDYDSDCGAILVRPTRIVSVTALDPSLIRSDNPIYQEA